MLGMGFLEWKNIYQNQFKKNPSFKQRFIDVSVQCTPLPCQLMTCELNGNIQ